MLADLRAALPDDVRVLITGDHGMLNVPPSRNFLTIEDEPELRTGGVRLIGGEGRFRQLYTAHPAEVAARWADRLGCGRLGPYPRGMPSTRLVRPDGAPGRRSVRRCAGCDAYRLAALTTTVPGEFGLVGMHGSLTPPQEMYVPLLID